MGYEKMADVVTKIAEQTANGKIKWGITASQSSFQTSFPKYSIRISSESHEWDEGEDFVISLYNSKGVLMERQSNAELRPFLPDSYSIMQDLFQEARRQAMGVDEAVDDILSSLDE